jgi:hypothetical protein
MRARTRSGRARTEGNNRERLHQKSAWASPAHVQREAPYITTGESAAFGGLANAAVAAGGP